MLLRPSNLLLSAGLLPALLAGCQQWNDLKARQDPVTHRPVNLEALNRYHHPMVVNAAAHDMAVADIHFVPHTAELNSLGDRRLAHLAEILHRYGGTVRYETFSKDRERISARLATVERHLAEIGIDMSNVQVAAMLSGGRGMSATDAMRVKGKLDESAQGRPATSRTESTD